MINRKISDYKKGRDYYIQLGRSSVRWSLKDAQDMNKEHRGNTMNKDTAEDSRDAHKEE